MFRKTGTKLLSRVPNKLFEAAAENVAQNLIGSLVQSKQDPLSKFLDDIGTKSEPETLVGMVVKIHTPNKTRKWVFDLLIEEKVQTFTYENFSDFYNEWLVVNRTKL